MRPRAAICLTGLLFGLCAATRGQCPSQVIDRVGGAPNAVAATEDYLYAGIGNRFVVIDVRDRRRPETVAELAYPEPVSFVMIDGSHAFIRAGRIRVIDIEQPEHPIEVGAVEVDSSGEPAYWNDHIYFRNAIIDVTHPARPRAFPWIGAASGYTWDGYLYGTTSPSRDVRVWSLANPLEPELVAEYEYPEWGRLAFRGDRAYGGRLGQLSILDVSEPADIRTIRQFDASANGDVRVQDDRLYFVNDLTRILSLSDPNNPTPISEISLDVDTLRVRGEIPHHLVLNQGNGLRLVDVTDPNRPLLRGRYLETLSATDAATDGRYVFVSDHRFGLRVMDPTAPAGARQIGSVAMPRFVVAGTRLFPELDRVRVEGPYAYLGNRVAPDLITIVDCTHPEDPTVVGSFPRTGPHLATAPGYVYQHNDGRVQVVDVTMPAAPQVVTEFELPGEPNDVAAGLHRAGQALLAAYTRADGQDPGLHVVDISNPLAPQVLDSLPTSVGIIAVDGAYLYVRNGRALQRIDFSDPRNPVTRRIAFNPDESFSRIQVDDGIAHLQRLNRISSFDVNDPNHPVLLRETTRVPGGLFLALGAHYVFHGWGRGLTFVTHAPAGELNLDAQVDISDLAIVLNNYGTLGGAPRTAGDTDDDSDVDLIDLLAVLQGMRSDCQVPPSP